MEQAKTAPRNRYPGRVAKGSYWRCMANTSGEWVLVRAKEEGTLPKYVACEAWHYVNHTMCRHTPDTAVLLSSTARRFYRCKKDGDWYGQKSTKAQQIAREYNGYLWRLSGSIQQLNSMRTSVQEDKVIDCHLTVALQLLQAVEASLLNRRDVLILRAKYPKKATG